MGTFVNSLEVDGVWVSLNPISGAPGHPFRGWPGQLGCPGGEAARGRAEPRALRGGPASPSGLLSLRDLDNQVCNAHQVVQATRDGPGRPREFRDRGPTAREIVTAPGVGRLNAYKPLLLFLTSFVQVVAIRIKSIKCTAGSSDRGERPRSIQGRPGSPCAPRFGRPSSPPRRSPMFSERAARLVIIAAALWLTTPQTMRAGMITEVSGVDADGNVFKLPPFGTAPGGSRPRTRRPVRSRRMARSRSRRCSGAWARSTSSSGSRIRAGLTAGSGNTWCSTM